MLLTALIFFLILSILVLIHEFGHYAVARWIGVHVEEFGLGLPPRILGRKIGKTLYSLNWLPIGGFVKLAGEDEAENSQKSPARNATQSVAGGKVKSQKQYFWARSKKERAAILVAGVTMNLLLAIGITGFLLTQGVLEPSGRVRIEKVQPGSPAEMVGLQENDVVSSITFGSSDPLTPSDTKTITTPRDLIDTTRAHVDEKVTITILRDKREQIVTVTPRKNPPPGQGPLGVAITDLELKTYAWYQIPGEAVRINLLRAKDMFTGVGSTIWRLVTLRAPSADVAGPIGIARVTGEAVKFGWKAVLEFMSILSLNLAVLNILPIPALDGGRLAFVFLEKIIGKKLRPAFERSAHQIGMIILMGLIILVSINDILKLARGL
ncbi:MAG: M50 family metallopeptidase [Candidatus Gottesmanbacteria bacterium]|nr:M50 family metallopeptidase [Candidatus Gottesmanbacteria bacterium]